MKKLVLSLTVIGLIGLVNPLKAQLTDGHERLKKHVNTIVNEVEETKDPIQKRMILDESLGEMITAIDRVSERGSVSETDKKGLAKFKEKLNNRKDELNGINGFSKVPNNQLNNYANFIQQDIEQADAVTISVTTALLIIIILLLL
jgi:hypothetical protein